MGTQDKLEISPVWPLILGGFLTLIISAYFDVLRGSMLPIVSADLSLPFSKASWFLAMSTVGAAVTTIAMISLLNHFRELTVLRVLCLIGIATSVTAWTVKSFPMLVVLGGLVGASVSSLGTMSNVLTLEGTPERLRGRMLNGLHACYGVGCMSGASLVGYALSHGAPWQGMYTVASVLIAILLMLTLRWMKPIHHAHPQDKKQNPWLSFIELTAVFAFALYVGGEVLTAMWITTILTKVRNIEFATAAHYLTLFFACMTGTRILCALFLKPKHEHWAIYLGLIIPIIAHGIGHFYHPIGYALVGLCGPFFPVFLARTSRIFPEKWRTLTIWMMTSISISIGLFNLVIGSLADNYGLDVAYLLPPLLFLLSLMILVIYGRFEPKKEAI